MFLDRKASTRAGVLDAFRLDEFFSEPWRGSGIIRDALGFKINRYEAHGRGRTVNGRVRLEHAYTLDNGLLHQGEWEVLESRDGRVLLRETVLDFQGQGWPTERGFRLDYVMPTATSFGMKRMKSRLFFTLTGPGEASSAGTIGLWGLPLTSISGEFRHES